MITITQQNNEGVHYTITSKLSVGRVVRIHPSEAYMGIEEDTVRVLYIGGVNGASSTEMPDNEVRGFLEMAGIHHESLSDLDLEVPAIDELIFVYYTSTSGDELGVLLLEEFLDHTTTY